jgi:hypothetical protein
LFCLGALKPWLLLSYRWTILAAKASMVYLQCIILSETLCDKNAEAAENGCIFQLVSVFEFSLTHARVECAAHQAVMIKARVCCVRVCNFSILACIVLTVASITKSCENQGCSLTFFWVV